MSDSRPRACEQAATSERRRWRPEAADDRPAANTAIERTATGGSRCRVYAQLPSAGINSTQLPTAGCRSRTDGARSGLHGEPRLPYTRGARIVAYPTSAGYGENAGGRRARIQGPAHRVVDADSLGIRCVRGSVASDTRRSHPHGRCCTYTDVAILTWRKGHAGVFACSFGPLSQSIRRLDRP